VTVDLITVIERDPPDLVVYDALQTLAVSVMVISVAWAVRRADDTVNNAATTPRQCMSSLPQWAILVLKLMKTNDASWTIVILRKDLNE
jgi:hypothetical protein